MSTVAVNAPHRTAWGLTAAVLVYEAAGTKQGAYATLHDIEAKGGRLRLGGGRPATKEACAGLARALGAASALHGFLPPNLIYLGARSLIWWRPPAAATVYFDTTKAAAGGEAQGKSAAAQIGKRTGCTPQPGLVFAVTPGAWFVYALAGSGRPGPETNLMRAPYFNVWADGKICTGNVRLPDTLSTSALDGYERAFFDSEFTHPNVHGRERLVRAQGGAYAFWRDLLDVGTMLGEFPVRQLIDLKLTIADLAKRLEKGDLRDA